MWFYHHKIINFIYPFGLEHTYFGEMLTENMIINKSTWRAQTSAMEAQFLDFQNLPLALIFLFPPLFHIFADSDPDHSQFIFHGSRQ